MAWRRTRRGFSVLEMMVAFALLVLALMLSAKLLQDTAMQISWSGRKALEVSPNLALEQIRTDLRGSAGTPLVLPGWQSAPLSITGSSSGLTFLYYVAQGQLLRRAIESSGKYTERVVLDQVVDLRYRAGPAGIEVELEFLRMKPPLRRDTAAGMREALAPDHRRMAIVVSPRRLPTEAF